LEDCPHPLIQHFWRQAAENRAPLIALHESATEGPWEALWVRRLEAAHAAQLLADMLQKDSLDDPAYNSLLDYAEGHPFTLRLIASAIRSGFLSPARLAQALPPADNPQDKARQLFEQVLGSVEAAGQGLLLTLSAAEHERVSLTLLEILLGRGVQAVARGLIERGLINPHDTHGRLSYGLHPLAKTFARDLLRASGRLPEVQERLGTALHRLLTTYAPVLSPQTALPLRVESPHVLRHAWAALERQDRALWEAWQEPLRQANLLFYQWGYQADLNALRQAWHDTPHTTPEPAPDDTQPTRPKEFSALIPYGETSLTTPQQNLLLQIAEASQRRDQAALVRLYSLLATDYSQRGMTALAAQNFKSAMQAAQELGDVGQTLVALVGAVSMGKGHWPTAEILPLAQRGVNMAHQLGDNVAQARLLSLMGDCYLSENSPQNAASAYKKALRLWREGGETLETGVTLAKLGALYIDLARYREATVALSQAIQLFEHFGRPDLQGRSLGNLGTALGHLGRWREAGQHHAAALRLARETGDREEERFQLANLAYVARQEGHRFWAVHYHRQALYLALLAEDSPSIAEHSFALGEMLAVEPENLPQAVLLLEAAFRHQPTLETGRLLKETQVRHQKRLRAGLPLKTPERDLLQYAGGAYPHPEG
jgi:tetratricopeptide (TPR) repeat protein